MDNSAREAATGPLLDLDTLISRPSILIDGNRYELLSPNELSVLASHRLGVRGRRIEALSKSEDESDGVELNDLMAKVAREVLVDVPDALFGRLTGAHLLAIVDVFTGLLLRNKLGVAGAMATAMGGPQIGETLFPGFSASSEERPAGGWRKRLARWFART